MVRVMGFVLCGGGSRRMGQDKALLETGGETLLYRTVRCLREAGCANVTLIGPPDRYAALGIAPVSEDPERGKGPLSGIVHALDLAGEDPAAILACDLPRLTPGLIRQLIDSFVEDAEIVSAAGEPLCAVYSPKVLPPAREALFAGRLRVRDLLNGNPRHIAVSAPSAIVWNANTPEDWAAR